jgi:hypothetical protein
MGYSNPNPIDFHIFQDGYRTTNQIFKTSGANDVDSSPCTMVSDVLCESWGMGMAAAPMS